jgi:Membrane protease subunits, stomatin/prohibitin homologs
MKKIAVVAAVAAGLLLSSCGYSTPSDMVAVQEGRGAEAKKVKGCKAPNERAFWGNDHYAYYPTNEREWVATGQDSADAGRMKSVTNDNVEMYLPVTIQFSMITDCDTITDFYMKHGRRNKAYFDEDGNYDENWVNTLEKLVATPADAALDRIVQDYNWRDVWNDPSTKTEMEKAFTEALNSETSLLVQRAQGKYFEDFSVLIGKPSPVEDALAQAVAQEQTAVATAKSAEAQAAAQEAQALAEVAVAKAEAAKKRAEIAGYSDVNENYLRFLAVNNGINPWQPTYLVGSGQVPNAK